MAQVTSGVSQYSTPSKWHVRFFSYMKRIDCHNPNAFLENEAVGKETDLDSYPSTCNNKITNFSRTVSPRGPFVHTNFSYDALLWRQGWANELRWSYTLQATWE
jgi:hypothetical protein